MKLSSKVLPCKTSTRVGDDMVWPSYNASVSDLAWKLRHAPTKVTKVDMLTAASVISAYLQMVGDTQKKRNAVCEALKQAV